MQPAFGFGIEYKIVTLKAKKVFSENLNYNNGLKRSDWKFLKISVVPIKLKDGKISLQHPHDAIASVANYLSAHGWKSDEEVATRVSYEGKRFSQYKTGYNTKYHRKELKGITTIKNHFFFFQVQDYLTIE